jgi:SAM-dependent methyltransferase
MFTDDLPLLESLVPLADARIVEAGCGAARLARELLERHPGAAVTGLEVDERQLARNLADPHPRLHFVRAGAQAMPLPDAASDGALMLKSLHHVPAEAMDAALSELARVLKPGGWLYVSEPVYAGPLNELVRVYNDEGVVRAQAQAALDRALAGGRFRQEGECRFEMPVHFADFADFERRMMRPTFADHALDADKLARTAALYAPHQGPAGAHFTRPMHVRLLRRAA